MKLNEIQIIQALSAVTKTLNRVEKNTGGDPKSPYATDRPGYDSKKILGSEKETEWKQVSISREQDLKEVTNENNNQIVENHSLGNKLNII